MAITRGRALESPRQVRSMPDLLHLDKTLHLLNVRLCAGLLPLPDWVHALGSKWCKVLSQ